MAFGSAGTYLTGASSTSANFAVPSGTTAGDTVFVLLYWEGTGTVTSPEGFDTTPVVALTTSPSSRGSLRVYKKDVTGSDSGTYAFTLSGTAAWREGIAWRHTGRATGAAAIDDAPATVELTTTGTSATVSSQTTATDGCDLIAVATNFTGFTGGSFPSGFTARAAMSGGHDAAMATLDNFTPAGPTGSEVVTGSPSGFLKAAVIAVAPTASAPASNTGTESGSLPVTTGSIGGTATDSGTVAGGLPSDTASIAGQSADTGSVTGTTPADTGSVTGTQTNAGTMAAALPVTTARVGDTTSDTGTTNGTLPTTTGAVTGTSSDPGTTAGMLPSDSGNVGGTSTDPGSTTSNLPDTTGSVEGTATNTGSLDTTTPGTQGSVREVLAQRDLTIGAPIEHPSRAIGQIVEHPTRIIGAVLKHPTRSIGTIIDRS